MFDYTAKGNLVAVISNGSAVLGLGNLGPLAAKPVMEGKAVLFKIFADIDVFDLELDATATEDIVRVVSALEPTFGGINLEDIAAPQCFDIETQLRARMGIPVFHDDQHGTAVVAAAAILNAFEVSGKALGSAQFVICGAGAAGLACAKLTSPPGRGPVAGRPRGLPKAFVPSGAGGPVSRQTPLRGTEPSAHVGGRPPRRGRFSRCIARRRVDTRHAARHGLGASDSGPRQPRPGDFSRSCAQGAAGRDRVHRPFQYPDQVNNVLAFPGVFRGALDVRATRINTEMKLAASRALAELTRERAPDSLVDLYAGTSLTFGPEYVNCEGL